MRHVGQDTDTSQRGVAMAALLVGLSIMAIMMTVAMPAWSHAVRREREIEMEWRGRQYQEAIRMFQAKYGGAYPPNVDVLVEQKFLRKKYKDPITGEDFAVIPVGVPPGTPPTTQAPVVGIQGVVSKSRERMIRQINGATTYDKGFFIGIDAAQQAGGTTGGGGAGGFPNAIRPGLPQNMAPPGSANPFATPPFGGGGALTPFGTPSAPPPAIPLFGAPAKPAPFGGPAPGMPAPGGSPPGPSGAPVFGGGGGRPPVAPPPTWRPR